MPTCPGCKSNFTSLSSHQTSCKALFNTLQHGPRRKREHQEQQSARLAKQRKLDAEAQAARVAKERAEAEAYARRMVCLHMLPQDIYDNGNSFVPQAELEALQPVIIPSVSRSGRQRRVPGKVRHMQPTTLAGLPEHLRPPPVPVASEAPPQDFEEPAHNAPPTPAPSLLPPVETRPNRFGVFQSYTMAPVHDPEEGLTVDDFTDCPTHTRRPRDDRDGNVLQPFGASILNRVKARAQNTIAPFLNVTVFRIMDWLYCSDQSLAAGGLACDTADP